MTREKKMIKRNIHNTFAALMAAIFLVAMPVGALAKSEVNQSFLGAVAIEGTDPVAYFTEKKAVKGSSEYSHCWKGAQWGFKNAANRDLFAAQPKKTRANSAAIAPGRSAKAILPASTPRPGRFTRASFT